MNITEENPTFTTIFCSPNVDDFIQLREQIGWGKIDRQVASTSLANSLFSVVIRHNEKLVGMARIVGDGAMYFYIQDVIVATQYQGQGIGRQLMQHIESYLTKHAQQGATIGLLSAKGKEGFYQSFGYQARPNNSLGHGMCKFV